LTDSLYKYLSAWPDRLSELSIGVPVGGMGYFLNVTSKKVSNESSVSFEILLSFELCIRMKADGNAALTAGIALMDSLAEYALGYSDGNAVILPGYSMSFSSPKSDGCRDFTLKMNARKIENGNNLSDGKNAPSQVKLILTLGGRTVEIGGESTPFMLRDVSGLEAAQYRVLLAENGISDASFLRGTQIPSRLITVDFSFTEDQYAAQRMEYLISSLHPRNVGQLYVKRGGISRKIGIIISDAEYFSDNENRELSVKLKLLCPDPFFYDENTRVYSVRSSVPLFSLPFNSLAGVGVTSSLVRRKTDILIKNTGHTDAGFTLRVYSPSGGVKNPEVRLGEKFIRVINDMEAGDSYEISTLYGDKYIKKNGDIDFSFDRHSEFFTLCPGENRIMISSEEGSEKINADFICSFRYFGV